MRGVLTRMAALGAAPLALASLVVSLPAEAHRGHDAMTLVRIGADGAVHVSHRFETHDIEPALVEIAPDAQPSLDDPDAVAALEAYVMRRFSISASGQGIDLHLARADIGASEVRIELVATLPRQASSLEIGSTILRDVYPDQIDQVVVDTGKAVRTLRFAGGEVQSVDLR